MAPGTTLRVLDLRGDIRVVPATNDEATVDGQTRGPASDRYPIVLEPQTDGQNVTICVYRKGADRCEAGGMRGDDVDMDSDHDDGGRHGGADITVLLPKGVRIQVVSGNGHIEVFGAGSDVIASSGNGAVTISGAEGRVNARSGNGAVEVASAAGPVSASTGNGAIDVRMGELVPTSDMHFSTGNGTITVTLPAAYAGELDASTGHGMIVSDFSFRVIGRLSPEHVHAEIGTGGGGRLRLVTGNGDLVLRKS
jgi:DUF4097 and DUF4098 domain-containing protein YvlB